MQEFTTIVSGLPRSGTSMMMRVLEAGGMEVAVDNVRRADEDNPRGYYEFEQVKNIRHDQSWFNGLQGKAVKMVSMLLYDLPVDKHYKIIFMKRNMQEILSSQRIMLERRGEKGQEPDEMARMYKKHLSEIEKWLREQGNIEVLFVNYNEMIKNPREIIPLINTFFNHELDTASMFEVVDPSLYRQRGGDQDATVPAGTHPGETATGNGEEKEKIEAQLRSLGYM